MSFPQEWGGVTTTPRSSHLPTFAFPHWNVVSSQSEWFVWTRREWTLCGFAIAAERIYGKNPFFEILKWRFCNGNHLSDEREESGLQQSPSESKGGRELPVPSLVLPTPRLCLSPECAWPRVTAETLSGRVSGAFLLMKGSSLLLREKENTDTKQSKHRPSVAISETLNSSVLMYLHNSQTRDKCAWLDLPTDQ